MIKQSFHNFLRGVSVLPALLVVPAMADPGIGFVDGYVAGAASQLHDVLNAQNTTGGGFNIGTITIGTDMTSVNDQSLRYGVANRSDATQYVHMTDVSMPNGFGDIYLDMPLYNSETGFGLTDNTNGIVDEIAIIEEMLGDGVVNREGSTVTSVTPHVSDAISLLGSASGMNIFHGQTWILNSLSSAIQSDEIGGGYLYTNDSFVVDGNYGNMAGTLLDTYETSLKNILDELAPNLENMTQQEVADKMSIKFGKMAFNALGFSVSEDLEKRAGESIFTGAFGISAYDVAGKWMNGELDTAITTYLTQIKTALADLNGLKLNVDQITMNGGNVTVKNTVNLAADQVAINGGNFTVDTGANLTIAGANLNVADGATLVNNGILNANSTNVALNSDLTGNGTLVIGENTTVNLGDANITQGTITLDGNMLMSLNTEDGARITASSIIGDGNLNLTFAGEGTYHLFGGDGTFKNGVSNSVYDITWINGDKDLTATAKSAADIATENNISAGAANTVSGLAGSSSSVLNELAVAMQEKLAEGTPAAKAEVEQATSAINPETVSVAQSVATSVQTTVTNLAGARMASPVAGRSAGDVNMVASGVWAQGLYNKTKMNDSFNGYTRGVAVGADGTLDNDVTIGIGYAFNHSDIASSSRDTEIDSNTVFVYGQYKPSEWYVNAILNYTWSNYSEDGTALGTPVTGEYDIGSFGAAVAGGYDFACGLTPELGLRYMHVNGEEYTTNLGNKNKFDSTDYLTGSLGAKYGFNIVANEEMLFRPELRYAFKYDLVSDESSASVLMPGTAAYTLDGDRLPRVGNEFGIGLTMKYRTMDLSLTYDIDVRKDYTSQTGMLKFRYNF